MILKFQDMVRLTGSDPVDKYGCIVWSAHLFFNSQNLFTMAKKHSAKTHVRGTALDELQLLFTITKAKRLRSDLSMMYQYFMSGQENLKDSELKELALSFVNLSHLISYTSKLSKG